MVEIIGNFGNDPLIGTGEPDSIFGLGTGDDAASGGDGDDVLSGDEGDDIFAGNRGADVLPAGAANNQLTGGSGPDAFTEPGSGFDQMTDFTTGPDDDRPAFAADVLEDFDPATSNLTAFFDLDGQADGTLFRVDSDGGGDGFVPVALLQGGERDLDRRSGGQPRSEPLDRVLAAGAPPRSRLPIGRRSS